MTARGTDKYATTFMASYIAYTEEGRILLPWSKCSIDLIQGVKQKFYRSKEFISKSSENNAEFLLNGFCTHILKAGFLVFVHVVVHTIQSE